MKRTLAFIAACMLALSMAACGGGQSAPQSQPAPSQQSGGDTAGDAASSRIGAAPSQSPAPVPQGDPETVDLNKMAEVYSKDETIQDRLGGKDVKVTGYTKVDNRTDELYLWGISHDDGSAVSINLSLDLSAEDEALLRSDDYFLACVVLTGRIEEGMTTDKEVGIGDIRCWYTLRDARYVTDILEVSGVLQKREGDSRLWIEGVGDVSFLDKDNIPAVGTEVTLQGKFAFGGYFREAVVVG